MGRMGVQCDNVSCQQLHCGVGKNWVILCPSIDSATQLEADLESVTLLRYLCWHDRGANQELVHKAEPQRKEVHSSLPLPPLHCPLFLPLPKGKLAPMAGVCLL